MTIPGPRYILTLGKGKVLSISKFLTYQEVLVDIQGQVQFRTQAPYTADIREGDMLTLYTEVLAKKDH